MRRYNNEDQFKFKKQIQEFILGYLDSSYNKNKWTRTNILYDHFKKVFLNRGLDEKQIASRKLFDTIIKEMQNKCYSKAISSKRLYVSFFIKKFDKEEGISNSSQWQYRVSTNNKIKKEEINDKPNVEKSNNNRIISSPNKTNTDKIIVNNNFASTLDKARRLSMITSEIDIIKKQLVIENNLNIIRNELHNHIQQGIISLLEYERGLLINKVEYKESKFDRKYILDIQKEESDFYMYISSKSFSLEELYNMLIVKKEEVNSMFKKIISSD